MPSTAVNFSHNNGAPGAIAGSSFNGTNAVPTARALAASLGAPDNGAPGVIVGASFAGTADLPAARAIAGLTPDNGAPGAIAGSSFNGTAAAPVARDLGASLGAPDNGAPGLVSGPAYAAANDAPSARPLAATAGTANVPQTVGPVAAAPTPTLEKMHTPSLVFAGRLAANQVFGLYKPAVAVAVRGVQLALQDPATGADVILELVDADGVGLGRTATLPAGQGFADVVFVTPLPLAANTLVRARLTQIGSAKAGSFLTATLAVQVP